MYLLFNVNRRYDHLSSRLGVIGMFEFLLPYILEQTIAFHQPSLPIKGSYDTCP